MTRAQASLLVLLGLLVALFWLAPDVPLLGFAAVLLAIALRVPAEWIASHTGMRRWVAVIALVAGLAGAVVFAGWSAWAPLVDPANPLVGDPPRGLAALRERLEGTSPEERRVGEECSIRRLPYP